MRKTSSSRVARTVAVALAALASPIALPVSYAQTPQRLSEEIQFQIPAQPLATALVQFSKQAKIQLVTSSVQLGAQETQGISGRLSIQRALDALLDRTGLGYSLVGENTVAITVPTGSRREASASAVTHLAQADVPVQSDTPPESSTENEPTTRGRGDEVTVAIPEVLVVGSRSLNVDIRRRRDDPQPYVIFDRQTIERSAALDLNEFLRARLPMNTVRNSGAQPAGGNTTAGNMTSIDLRGLGTDETLILVDGRRIVGPLIQGGLGGQGDINGIPLSAIERIEILPTTASGIYGGSATGGVVNIVLRRDYSGVEARLNYDNTFDSDSSIVRGDLTAGFNLEGGKTSILVAGSYSESSPLEYRDRSFILDYRRKVAANNPNFSTAPLGATPNIRTASGLITSVPAGYAGGGGLTPLMTNAGAYNVGLADTAQTGGGGAHTALFSAPTMHSLSVAIRRQFGARVQAFLDIAASDNSTSSLISVIPTRFSISATAPNNPFRQNLLVSAPIAGGEVESWADSETRRATAGIIFSLPAQWQLEMDYNRNELTFSSFVGGTVSSSLSANIANGTIDILRDLQAFPISDIDAYIGPSQSLGPYGSTQNVMTMRAVGPVWQLPGGPITISALAERREDDFGDYTVTSGASQVYWPSQSQAVNSLYLEARVPLVSPANSVAGIRALELQLSGRYDRYRLNAATSSFNLGSPSPIQYSTSTNSSANPTIGVSYKPIDDVQLRASYGTGFLPPNVYQVLPQDTTLATTNILDPRRGNTPVGAVVDAISGGNPDLRPEESESWSAGLILTPRFMPGVRLSVDYTRIEKTDNIGSLPNLSSPGAFELYESMGRITRGPNLPGDAPGWAGPIVLVNRSRINIERLDLEAFDVQVDYRLETVRFGAFDFFALGTWTPHLRTQVLPNSPVVENAGGIIAGSVISSTTLKFRSNAGLTWSRGPWAFGWNTSYYHHYVVNPTGGAAFVSQGSPDVRSQSYHDAFAAYRFESSGVSPRGFARLTSGLDITLGVRNVFNTEPPLDVFNQSSFYSTFGDARLASYYLTIRKSFE